MIRRVRFATPLVTFVATCSEDPARGMPDESRERLMKHLRKMAEKIVILSIQGFQLKNIFVCKELGVSYPIEGVSASYYFCPPPNIQPNSKQETFAVKHLHGLSFSGGVLPYGSLKKVLKSVAKNRTAYVKGIQQQRFLTMYGISAQNLEDFGCPKNTMLPNENVNCGLKDHDVNTFCAERKAKQYGIFLLNKNLKHYLSQFIFNRHNHSLLVRVIPTMGRPVTNIFSDVNS